MGFILISSLDDLKENEGKSIKIDKQLIALFKLADNQVYAIENFCPHVGAPLDNGIVEGRTLSCLWHGWSFDLATGFSINCPGISIKTYPVKIEDRQVFVEIN